MNGDGLLKLKNIKIRMNFMDSFSCFNPENIFDD